ncbi:DUF4202 family protein [Nanoarchaeota archaeon]
MGDLYQEVEKFIRDAFTQVNKEIHIQHAIRTVHWVEQIKPDADLALRIAALGHDIEKAFRQDDMDKRKQSVGYTGEEFLRPHEERSAEIIGDFLSKQGADKEIISKVCRLISRHEEGGDEEQSILRDSDSASFFEVYSARMIEKVTEVGKQKVRDKLDWMYNRIGSNDVKGIVKPMHEKAIQQLDS